MKENLLSHGADLRPSKKGLDSGEHLSLRFLYPRVLLNQQLSWSTRFFDSQRILIPPRGSLIIRLLFFLLFRSFPKLGWVYEHLAS